MDTKTPNLTGQYVHCDRCNRQTRVEIHFENDAMILWCGHHVSVAKPTPEPTITQVLQNIATNAEDIRKTLDVNKPVEVIYEDIREMAAAILVEANALIDRHERDFILNFNRKDK